MLNLHRFTVLLKLLQQGTYTNQPILFYQPTIHQMNQPVNMETVPPELISTAHFIIMHSQCNTQRIPVTVSKHETK